MHEHDMNTIATCMLPAMMAARGMPVPGSRMGRRRPTMPLDSAGCYKRSSSGGAQRVGPGPSLPLLLRSAKKEDGEADGAGGGGVNDALLQVAFGRRWSYK
jgi:hypothetical protein